LSCNDQLEINTKANMENMMNVLLMGGGTFATPPLCEAAQNGLYNEVVELVQQGTDVNLVDEVSYLIFTCQHDQNRMSALHYAATDGNAEIVAFLLDNHADVDAQARVT
jgi:hypothetical protein